MVKLECDKCLTQLQPEALVWCSYCEAEAIRDARKTALMEVVKLIEIEIEKARQLQTQDPIATRSCLERVKRMVEQFS